MSPAIRLSLGLAFLTASILLLGDLVGVVPNASESVVEARRKLSESLAIQFAGAAAQGEMRLVQSTMEALTRRNPELLSVALRAVDGKVYARAGDHDAHWVTPTAGASTPTHIQVPIHAGDRQWGSVEVRFAPLGEGRGLWARVDPVFALIGFVAVLGFASFLLVIRRALRALDPSSVIPDRVRAAFDTLTEGVLILDQHERIVLANSAFTEKVERSSKSLIGQKASGLPWAGDAPAQPGALPWLRAITQGGVQMAVPLAVASETAGRRAFMVNASPILDERGKARGALVTFDDVTDIEEKNAELAEMLERLRESEEQIRRQNEELERLAMQDPLTSCLNRRSLFGRLEAVFQDAVRDGTGLAVVMSDIDHFKSVNDRFGHGVGDKVIKMVAEVLKSQARPLDFVGRYGGEEFCVVLPGMTGEQAIAIAERFRVGVFDSSDARFTSGLRITSSFGVAGIETGASDPLDLVNQADRALYGAKRSGRNRVMRWGDEEVARLEEAEAKRRAAGEQAPGESRALQAPSADAEAFRARVLELEQKIEARERELREAYGRDSVTGLPSRVLFYDRVAQATARADRYHKLVAVVSLEVTTFDRVNETLGPIAGEALLQVTGQKLVNALRKVDTVTLLGSEEPVSTVSRLTGNEFGLVLADVDHIESVTWIVERLINAVAGDVTIEGRDIYTASSVGVSVYPNDGVSAEDLIKNAAAARREAQRSLGRNSWRFYDQTIHQRSLHQLELEQKLRRAVQDGELVLHYQPRVDLESGRCTSLEALVRWEQPGVGLVFPGDFIPVAEQTGVIRDLGLWVLEQGCAQIRAWDSLGVGIAVNVSPVELQGGDFAERVVRVLGRHGIEPRRLELEITETALMENLASARTAMRQLHEAGVRLAIDDFGVGYSSLGYLRELPVDVVKIDRSFLVAGADGGGDDPLLAGIIGMAHGMGLRVVGEGVETREQLSMLERLGCDEAQGYLLGRPMPVERASEVLQDGAALAAREHTPSAPVWPQRLRDVLPYLRRVSARGGPTVTRVARGERRISGGR
jgi:diguanylate cyclase (GGDEF)-like protein